METIRLGNDFDSQHPGAGAPGAGAFNCTQKMVFGLVKLEMIVIHNIRRSTLHGYS
jgi:hypothetical protein